MGHILPTMMIRTIFIALALLVQPALAERMPRSPADVVKVSILPGWRVDTYTHLAGLHMALAPGWKTYWRAPGDGGIPTRIDTGASRNIDDLIIHWPRPQVFRISGMRSLGYENAVTLPLEISVSDPGQVRLAAQVVFGICREVCIPVALSVAQDLPARGAMDPRIVAALEARPRSGVGIARAACELLAYGQDYQLNVSVQTAFSGAGEAMAIELEDDRIWVGEPRLARQPNWWHGMAKLMVPTETVRQIHQQRIRITLLTEDDAIDINGCHGR